mmetsp:Transcript_17483/g.30570  ORF Transcript_17483/g.30570 Transcript_17483/m.30570 type:complete len:244 (+) Transcript_17483:1326-2057(+)
MRMKCGQATTTCIWSARFSATMHALYSPTLSTCRSSSCRPRRRRKPRRSRSMKRKWRRQRRWPTVRWWRRSRSRARCAATSCCRTWPTPFTRPCCSSCRRWCAITSPIRCSTPCSSRSRLATTRTPSCATRCSLSSLPKKYPTMFLPALLINNNNHKRKSKTKLLTTMKMKKVARKKTTTTMMLMMMMIIATTMKAMRNLTMTIDQNHLAMTTTTITIAPTTPSLPILKSRHNCWRAQWLVAG